jgi:hypothetical protein
MFSVVKLKKSFWSAAGCAGYYFAFMHFLTRVGKYNNICPESFIEFVLVLSFSGIGGCYFLVLQLFLNHFLDVLIFLCCSMNRDIWRGIFAA